MTNQNDSKKKTAIDELRDRFYSIRDRLQPSKKLKDALKRKKINVARPYNPKNEVGT